MASLIRVEGIGPVYTQQLKDAGIRSTEALLDAGKTPQGRKDLAETLERGTPFDLGPIVGEQRVDALEILAHVVADCSSNR